VVVFVTVLEGFITFRSSVSPELKIWLNWAAR
jgi:hypothetical protein